MARPKSEPYLNCCNFRKNTGFLHSWVGFHTTGPVFYNYGEYGIRLALSIV
jgi:hypothetical protein